MLRVEVVCCPNADEVDRVLLSLPVGATVLDALRASGLLERHASMEANTVGVWGRVVAGDTPLVDGDRVELYRPLTIDPKEARRQRAQRQRAGR